MLLRRRLHALVLASALVGSLSHAQASIVRIAENAFQPSAGVITFSEPGFSLGTVNPTYTPADYGGQMNPNAPTVTFGGYFTGQSLGNADSCPVGAAISGCVVGTPTATLSLDSNSPSTFITNDGSQPNSPILSGSPRYNGPISILFSRPQAGVGLFGGYFNSVGSTAITAFDINGNVIGRVENTITGVEFLGLATGDQSATIAGLQFSLVGNEPAGFDIDTVRFGVGGAIMVPSAVPLPSSMPMFGAAIFFLGAFGYKLKRKGSSAV